LVKQGADVNAPEADGTTALHWAVRANDPRTVDLLIRAGANVKAVNRYGVSPVFLAATNGNAALIAALLKAGADPNSTLPGGETVLMTAASAGSPEAVMVLLAHGALVNAKEQTLGETALMWAVAENHAAAAQVLLEHGADINARSIVSTIPKTSPVQLQIAFPAGDWTSLMYGARQGALDAVRTLADAGADLNVADPLGCTALTLAILNAHYDVANLLLEKGADPNVIDRAGMTPLYAAVDMHTLRWEIGRPLPFQKDKLDAADLAKVLLTHGANPNASLTAPTLRRHVNDGDRNLGPGTTPFMRAAKTADVALMRLLLANGADPMLTQEDGTNALMIVAGVKYSNPAGEGPRIVPVTQANEIDAIKLCLEHGVDINAANDVGDTALHGAVRRIAGGDPILEFLANHGANLQARNKAGMTALDVAVGPHERLLNVGDNRKDWDATAALLRRLMSREK
jgi:ankyrin repeat protein